MITWGQYISYLLAGTLYYLMLAAFFSVAAGFSLWAIALVLLALGLGGYASGMSFIMPRISAMVAGAVALIFLVYSVALVFSETGEIGNLLVALPAAVALAFSVAALRLRRDSLWQRQKSKAARAGLGLLIAIPALLATYVFLYMASRLLL